jgi:hypothetical protein
MERLNPLARLRKNSATIRADLPYKQFLRGMRFFLTSTLCRFRQSRDVVVGQMYHQVLSDDLEVRLL